MSNDRHASMRGFNKAISNRAWDEMRNSQYIEPRLVDEQGLRFGRPQLMLWAGPAGFSEVEPHTLTVFQPFEATLPLVRKAAWSMLADLEPLLAFEAGDLKSLPEPTPTISVADETIDAADFETRLAEAFDLQIAVAWPWPKDRESLTTDVGVVGFEFYDIAEPQANIRCAWSVDLPSGWEPIADWFARMYGWLDSHFEGKNPQ